MMNQNRTIPLFVFPLGYAFLACIFPDRFLYLPGLLLSVVLVLASVHTGRRMASILGRLSPSVEVWNASCFPLGLGIILGVSYVCFSISTHTMVVALLWIIAACLGLFEIRLLRSQVSSKLLWTLPFLLLAAWSSFTPATFFDALVYHLGLPYRYLSDGEMSIIPHHLYSSFPPFEQVLNVLFVATGAVSGIKIFSTFILFGTGYSVFVFLREENAETDVRFELSILPLLLLPTVWLLVHLITADLLTALFFCSGCLLLLRRQNDQFAMAAILIAFSGWTKSNVYLYFPALLLLFPLKLSRSGLYSAIKVFAIIVLILLPLWIRNFIVLGDPVYPVLSQKLSGRYWSEAEEKALRKDSFPDRVNDIQTFVKAPFRILLKGSGFGSGGEIGWLPLLSLLLYPFAARKSLNRLLLFVLVCFAAWIFAFPNFRQFLPVFFLLIPVFSASWVALARRSIWLCAFGLSICALLSGSILLPFYTKYFPLIPFSESQAEYLRKRLDYYSIAELVAKDRGAKVMLIGETRSAYFRVPAIAGSAYNRSPFLEQLRRSGNSAELAALLKQDGITVVVYNPGEFRRLATKFELWKTTPAEDALITDFLRTQTLPQYRSGSVYMLKLK